MTHPLTEFEPFRRLIELMGVLASRSRVAPDDSTRVLTRNMVQNLTDAERARIYELAAALTHDAPGVHPLSGQELAGDDPSKERPDRLLHELADLVDARVTDDPRSQHAAPVLRRAAAFVKRLEASSRKRPDDPAASVCPRCSAPPYESPLLPFVKRWRAQKLEYLRQLLAVLEQAGDCIDLEIHARGSHVEIRASGGVPLFAGPRCDLGPEQPAGETPDS